MTIELSIAITIILLVLLTVVTIRGYHNLLDLINEAKMNLKKIDKKMQKCNHTSKDMGTMQKDLIEFRQSLINIDAKYKIKLMDRETWTVDKISELTNNQSIILKSFQKIDWLKSF